MYDTLGELTYSVTTTCIFGAKIVTLEFPFKSMSLLLFCDLKTVVNGSHPVTFSIPVG